MPKLISFEQFQHRQADLLCDFVEFHNDLHDADPKANPMNQYLEDWLQQFQTFVESETQDEL